MILIVYAQYLFLQPVIALRTGHCVYQDDVAVADSGNTLTGQYAVHCIPVRPRTAHAAYPAVALFFPEAVELRLRKISGSLAKDIVTAAQFTIFTFQLFQTLTFSGGEPTITAPGIPLMLAYPDSQSLRCTANLWGNGTNCCPL